ncbi:MAG: hypothetical protein RI538_07025 [Salibaculum sp.]|jgi:hypothetical protein|uniref:hypothetical protein n=1 Tax=Salibaculum sp. TaxID=2855480 RepID=UPI0028709DAF|nr:hypothetical protein [Salibaculum sp.]MDR9482522.1 hypothetical protein [Salibaculum sp.]
MDEYTVGDAVKDAQDGGSKAVDMAGEAARRGGEAISNTPMDAVVGVIVLGLGVWLFLQFLAWVGRN